MWVNLSVFFSDGWIAIDLNWRLAVKCTNLTDSMEAEEDAVIIGGLCCHYKVKIGITFLDLLTVVGGGYI